MTATVTDYTRAESYLPWRVRRHLHAVNIRPHWTGEGDRFRYRVTSPAGERHVEVDPERGTVSDVGEPARPAATEPADATALRSPDGSRAVFVDGHDLWVRDTATGAATRLTRDGAPGRDYATALPSPLAALGVNTSWPPPGPAALWSPDGCRLLTHRIDSRDAARSTLVQAVPLDGSPRPRRADYVYPLPGETAARVQLLVFDVATGRRVEVRVPPLDQLYFGSPLATAPGRHGRVRWSADGRRCHVLRAARGGLTLTLYEVDAATGAARILVSETDDVPVDGAATATAAPCVRVLTDGRVLWYSQRDGWGHLYLHHPATGGPPRQLTRGEWVVADVVAVDEPGGCVYATAVGREPGRDRYERLLYRVALDGGPPELLTPDAGSHTVSVSPSRRWCVTTRSTLDSAPVTELRDLRDGTVKVLETADLSELTGRGWTPPQRFTAPGRDGATEVNGVLIRPSGFDPRRRYPVIDAVYGAPGMNRAPVSLSEAGDSLWQAQAIAELGFVVVMVDGLGMPYRSKAFRRRSYRDLGDAGLPDHIAALRHLAATRPYLDLDRVGVYGHSAGGYTACRAMFVHADFYRVGVASAGNHDHRLDKAAWVERHLGPPGDHYADQANPPHAAKLRGRLLLAHGELDDNVHPSATLAVAAALIDAGKDFDLLILPNRGHALGADPYFVRRRWDHLVWHLAGREPPAFSPASG